MTDFTYASMKAALLYKVNGSCYNGLEAAWGRGCASYDSNPTTGYPKRCQSVLFPPVVSGHSQRQRADVSQKGMAPNAHQRGTRAQL